MPPAPGQPALSIDALSFTYSGVQEPARSDISATVAEIGLNPEVIRFGLLGAIAMTTVIAVQTVGVVLVLALLVTPAAAASMVSRKLRRIITLVVQRRRPASAAAWSQSARRIAITYSSQ